MKKLKHLFHIFGKHKNYKSTYDKYFLFYVKYNNKFLCAYILGSNSFQQQQWENSQNYIYYFKGPLRIVIKRDSGQRHYIKMYK